MLGYGPAGSEEAGSVEVFEFFEEVRVGDPEDLSLFVSI